MNKNTQPPPVPRGRPATMVGGVAVVAAGIFAWWLGIQRHQAKKEKADKHNPGTLPTWEHRMYQNRNPVDNSDKPSTLRTGNAEGSSPPPPPNSSGGTSAQERKENKAERADRAVPSAPQSKSGASPDPNVGPAPTGEPTPQRTRKDDGRVYTKAAKYVDDYDEHKPKNPEDKK